MAREKANRRMKNGAALLALAMAAMIPFAAFAETTMQEAPAADATASATVRTMMPGRGGHGFAYGSFAFGGYSLDTSSLTEEQKAAYDSAVALYEQVEDAVLADLTTAGVVAQADVDSYIALRTAEKSLAAFDKSGWTAQQYKAYYEANAKTGDERKTAMQALVEAGQLKQEQADALSAQGGSGLWATILKNASTNSAIQTAISTLRQARETLNSTLKEAGIAGMGKGMMFEGFGPGEMGFGQGMDRNNKGNGNGNNHGNMPQGGRDGRR